MYITPYTQLQSTKKGQMVLVGNMYYACYSVCVGEEGEGGKGWPMP